MNETETTRPAAGASLGGESLAQQVQQLRTLLGWIVVFLLLLSGSLNVFLWRQVVYARKDLAVIRPQVNQAQVNQIIAEYQRDVPRINEFLNRLVEYAKTHPDVSPIMNKYRISAATVQPAAPAAGAAPAPAPPVPAPQ